MKFIGIVIKKRWNNDDSEKGQYFAEISPLYDKERDANCWIGDQRNETIITDSVISVIYGQRITMEKFTVIAINDEKSNSNYSEMLSWLAVLTQHL